jgi:hypothetical protein
VEVFGDDEYPCRFQQFSHGANRAGDAPEPAQDLGDGDFAVFGGIVGGIQFRQRELRLDVIAARAAEGSDAHYAQLAQVATVNQLRTAITLEPHHPDPDPRPERQPGITKTSDDSFDVWRITLAHAESAVFDAALQSHRDALIAEWKTDREASGPTPEPPPFPTTVDAFVRLVHAGWDGEVHARPHGQRTTVVVHLDIERKVGALHLGPLLSDAERQYLSCDATAEVWFERDGQVIGAGRATRTISRRLRRARLDAANGSWLWALIGTRDRECGGWLARWPD